MLCDEKISDITVSDQQRKLRDLHMAHIDLASTQDENTRSASMELVDKYIAAIVQELQPGLSLDPRLYRA